MGVKRAFRILSEQMDNITGAMSAVYISFHNIFDAFSKVKVVINVTARIFVNMHNMSARKAVLKYGEKKGEGNNLFSSLKVTSFMAGT